MKTTHAQLEARITAVDRLISDATYVRDGMQGADRAEWDGIVEACWTEKKRLTAELRKAHTAEVR